MTASSIKQYVKYDLWPDWAKTGLHRSLIYLNDVKRVDLLRQASAMAYTTLFSLVPSIAGLFTLLGLFLPILGNHANLLDEARQFLFKNLANGSGTQVVDYLESFIAGLNLKKIGMMSFVIILWTLISLLTQIEGALNRIWLVSQARPMLTRFIYFWLFLTLGMLGLSILLGLSTSSWVTALITKKTLAVADSADDIPIVVMTFNWLIGCGIFFLVYKVVPNCNVETKSASRGALLAGTFFYVLSKLYTIYVSRFASYKSVYGTLAAVPIFLMWIYICWIIALAGALFAWRWQTGFPELSEKKTIEAATTSLEHLRNHTIRTRLPLLALLTIFHKFSDGSGEGISTSELVSRFHLPYDWIFQAIEVLREQGLVLAGRPNLPKLAGGDLERWFPTQPAASVSIDKFMSSISEPVDRWFETWEPQIPKTLKDIVVSDAAKVHGKSVHDVLQKT